MKRIICLLTIFVLVLSLASVPAEAAGGSDKIKVGYYYVENYMTGLEEGEMKSGLAYDILCEIAMFNGWQYEFVYGSFDELYEQLLAGKIDILPCVCWTEQRAEEVLFTKEAISEETYYIFAYGSGLQGIKENDLSGKSVAVVAGTIQDTIFESWKKENDISMKKVYADSFDEVWELLKEGRCDFAISLGNSVPDSGFQLLFRVGAVEPYLAVAPGRTGLQKQIDEAYDKIAQINPFMLTHLREKYLSAVLSSHSLTKEELAWFDGRDVLRVAGFSDDRPYTFMDSNGEPSGVYPQIVNDIIEGIGLDISIEWVFYSTMQQMEESLFSGEVDLICPDYHGYSIAESKGKVISNTIEEVNMGILYKENTSQASIRTVATPATKLGVYYVQDSYPDWEIIPCNSADECVQAVADGRADAAVAHTTVLESCARSYVQRFNIETLLAGCPICFGAKPEDSRLIQVIDRGLYRISSQDFQAMLMQYSAPEKYTIDEFLLDNKLFSAAMILVLLLAVVFIAERSANASKLQKHLDEITKKNEIIEANEQALIRAEEEANAANRAKSTFLFNMSHDIRTPMNAILGYTGIARGKTKEPETQEYLEKIDTAGNQLLALVNQVLEMSRIESGKIVLQEQKTDLADFIDITHTVYGEQAEAKGLDLIAELRNVEHRHVIGDTNRISQILNNLIGNALKYTPAGGTVTTVVEEEQCDKPGYSVYKMTVKDTGIGISEEYLPHIFEEFTREKSSTVSKIQGTGLGMPIVKKLTELMGGTIEVESRLGEGSTFTVRIPLKIDTEYKAEERPTAEQKEISLEGMKILLVEDNEMNREIATDILTDAGALVDTAEDGTFAVEKVENSVPGQYDVILMDVQMPQMDGYEATRRIRALENRELAGITIFAMTANAFEEDRQEALKAGMNGHLAKPLDVPKLLATLSELMK